MRNLFLVLTLVMAVGVSGYSVSVSGIVTPMLDMNDSNSTVVDKINIFNVRQSLASEYQKIIKMSEDRIYFEGHLGFSGNYLLSLPSTYLQSESLYHISTNNLGDNLSLLFKFNLFNPKMPYYNNYLISEIKYLEELNAQYGIPLSQSASNTIADIKKKIEDYNNEFWYKRISVGFGIPMDFLGTGVSYPSFFAISDAFFFAGYDLGDLITIELGSNFTLNRIFFGISFDITTPLYQSSGNFIDFLKSTFGQGYGTSSHLQPVN